ncbi:1-aminocyclopropane-1-carboxylate deaminase [Gloeophyllum trabeum ATCC 11539]|uniref:1-aminocyclopropane-1-carboxylate deaminase n=1 Tax=Gloeophyllum trabeum (strain ATCC 11539 / FP-39264 / Madison 617) TaxID=670483 RepID=S7RER0_GLOTA|nr:1-aminocyclopropane-1-carboxylate deaminase [Gloeophyllum trabeum ATCC 11539]EPQ52735.1 1-aminocyclopropane-1-carboxylate deaminase [Gloeophyllum trabeum ATCC 11539]
MAATAAQLPGWVSKLRSFPKERFLFGPSPVQHLPRLSAHLGGASIWAKREDCNSGLAYGGNKVRKLEYVVADALKEGADTLVSIGGVQSNHTRAVTACAAASGLKAVTLQEAWVPYNPPLYDKTGNILLSRLMGGDVRLNSECFHIGPKASLDAAVRELKDRGAKPYSIPAGASLHPLGALGFVDFIVELAGQEKDLGVFFDTIVVCSVTGSSHSGIAVGALLEGRGRKVIGIDASGRPVDTKAQVTNIAKDTLALLDPDARLPDDAVVLDERFHAGMYGIPDEQTKAAMRLGAQLEAFITDPVYEGKSLAGLIHLVRSGEIAPSSKVLYVHLGGQPALNAYSEEF